MSPEHGTVDASAVIAGLSDGVSPTKRNRKKALLGHSDGGFSSVLQASMALDNKEKEMVSRGLHSLISLTGGPQGLGRKILRELADQ